MVLLTRGSRCSLCGELVDRAEKIVGFTHFLGREHRLWRYSDSAMHASCYAAWPDREEFAGLYAEAMARRPAPSTEELEESRRRDEAEREARSRKDREHNLRSTEVMRLVAERGASCPHCGTRSIAYRELAGTGRVYVVCDACKRSCNADELRLD
jgi:hypothetical protein